MFQMKHSQKKHYFKSDINHPKHRAQLPELVMGAIAGVVAFGLALVMTSRTSEERAEERIAPDRRPHAPPADVYPAQTH